METTPESVVQKRLKGDCSTVARSVAQILNYRLLDCDAVWARNIITDVRSKMLPLSSELKRAGFMGFRDWVSGRLLRPL